MSAGARWRGLRTIAVTGTKGKTTTTSMIGAIVAAAGEPAAVLTTLGASVGGVEVDGPAAQRLDATLERAATAGTRTLAIEVVSWALEGGFAEMCPPDHAVLTNLFDDHVVHHGSPAGYLAAKARLFRAARAAVLNACDDASATIDAQLDPGVRRTAYAARASAPACAHLPIALAAEPPRCTRTGTTVAVGGPLGARLGGTLSLRVVGAVNVDNALAAATAAHDAGYPPEAIAAGLAGFAGVPGRLEVVSMEPWVLVDYAHIPDALERVLRAVRAIVDATGGGTITCVLGCGGEQSHARRPALGRIAARLADRLVLTTDNPRREDPAAIVRDIEAGFTAPPPLGCHRELDRRRAIAAAVADAGPRDAVVIAGKGAESTQEIRGRTHPWSDVAAARAALQAGRAACT